MFACDLDYQIQIELKKTIGHSHSFTLHTCVPSEESD